MDGVENKLTNEELKQSYEKVFQELNEVQTGLNGKEKIEGLSGILTATLLEELEKPENKKVKDSLKDAYQTIINNPNLSRRAGDGLREVGVFLGGKSEKFGEDIKEDYDEFMKKLLNPEKLSRMNRDEVAKVKLYLSDKTHEQDAYKMYESIRKESVKYESLKGQDREFIDEVWETLKTNYENADYFMEKEYGKIPQDVRSLQEFCRNVDVKNWEGSNLKMEDVTSWHKESFVPHKKVVDKFNEMNEKRIKKNEELVKNIKLDVNIKDFKLEGNTVYISDQTGQKWEEATFENLGKSKYAKDYMDKASKVGDFVTEFEKNKISKECAKTVYENMIVGITNQLKQNEVNDTLNIDEQLLLKINSFVGGGKEKQFIVKDGENVTYYPENAADYLGTLISKGIKWNELEKKDKESGERQAWIAAVQVLLNSDKKLGDPIKVNGEYEAKVNNPTYDRVVKFQQSHNIEFAKGKTGGWGIDGKPGQNTISVLVRDQENREVEHNKLFGDINGIGKFENGEFKFDDSILKDGIVTIDGNKYKKYEENMTGLGYSVSQNNGEFGLEGSGNSYLYVGNFEDGKPKGEGTVYFVNGDKYQGNFENGKLNADMGTYTSAGGDSYVGARKDGKCHGLGTYTLKEKGTWVGNTDSEKKEFSGFWVGKGVREMGVFSVNNLGDVRFMEFKGGTVLLNGHNYTVLRDDKGLKIKGSEDKYIDENSWRIVSGEELSKVNKPLDDEEKSPKNASQNREKTAPGGRTVQAEQRTVQRQLNKPVENPDPDGINKFGYRKFDLDKAQRERYNIPKDARVYKYGSEENSYFYADERGNIFKVDVFTSYMKQQMKKGAKGLEGGKFSVNLCNDGMQRLSSFLRWFPSVKIIKKPSEYYMQAKNWGYSIDVSHLDNSTPFFGGTNCDRKVCCLALYLCCKDFKDTYNQNIKYDFFNGLCGADAPTYGTFNSNFPKIGDPGAYAAVINKNGQMNNFLAWVNK